MDPIILCAHRNLLIAVAIVSDLCFAGSTLNFHIFCLRFGTHIIPVFHIPVWVGWLASSCPGLPCPLDLFLLLIVYEIFKIWYIFNVTHLSLPLISLCFLTLRWPQFLVFTESNKSYFLHVNFPSQNVFRVEQLW